MTGSDQATAGAVPAPNGSLRLRAALSGLTLATYSATFATAVVLARRGTASGPAVAGLPPAMAALLCCMAVSVALTGAFVLATRGR